MRLSLYVCDYLVSLASRRGPAASVRLVAWYKLEKSLIAWCGNRVLEALLLPWDVW